MANFIKQVSTATSGTISMPDTKQDCVLIHDAAGLAVTLTIAFPGSPADGQQVKFISTLGVTTLTLSAGSTIVGGLVALAALGFASFIYESGQNKWFRIG